MDRKWFVLTCCADRADDLLRGVDNFPDGVYSPSDLPGGSAALKITKSNTREGSYVIYPGDEKSDKELTLSMPDDVRDIASPNGQGIVFTTKNDIHYHVFADHKTGSERGTTTYTSV